MGLNFLFILCNPQEEKNKQDKNDLMKIGAAKKGMKNFPFCLFI